MTSTSFNIGFEDKTRLSSRVLRPPGGGHTDIFGGEPEPQQGRRRHVEPVQHGQIGEAMPNGDSAPKAEKAEAAPAAEPMAAPEPVAEVAPPAVEAAAAPSAAAAAATPAAAAAATPAAAAAAEPQRRGRVPPGGFSSGLW